MVVYIVSNTVGHVISYFFYFLGAKCKHIPLHTTHTDTISIDFGSSVLDVCGVVCGHL